MHLILYFLDYSDPDIFEPKELEIFKQFCLGYTKVHYLFVCTKFCEVNSIKVRSQEIIEGKKESHMIKVRTALNKLCSSELVDIIYYENEKNIENEEQKIKRMTIIDYLYSCQKRIDIVNFNPTLISENEKLSTIINLENSIGYINTKKCIKNGITTNVYGMKNIMNKIIAILKIIEKENRIIYNRIKEKVNKNELIELNEIKEIPLIPDSKDEERTQLVDGNNNFFDDKIKKIDDILNELEKKALKSVRKHKLLTAASGILPILDIPIQHFIKKYAIKKIAKIFEDNMIEIKIFDSSNIKTKEDKIQNELIKETKDKINDLKTDIGKTFGRFLTITGNVFNFLGKLTWKFIVKIGTKMVGGILAGGGLIIGVAFGTIVMVYDIGQVINLYKNRLKFRCLVIDSFSPVIEYLNKFEEN